MSPLPKGVPPGELDRLLASCDRQCARGRRDYAILSLLSRLGLRAGEVAAIVLEDLDWRRGELVVHGKARRDEALPLPAVISSFQDRHVVDLGGHVEDGVVDVTAVAA